MAILGGGGVIMVVADANGGDGWMIAIFLTAMAVMIAFFKSPYIKIGNTIIAAKRVDRQPDPPEDEAEAARLTLPSERK